MTSPITSTTNPTVKALADLKTRRARNSSGRFIIEGSRAVARAIEAGVEIDRLVFCPALLDAAGDAVLGRWGARATLEVAEAPFRKIAYRRHPDGLVATAVQFPTDLEHLPAGPNPLYLVAEAIEKPGNLGAMLRTADAAGATGVVVADPTTDVFNPNVVRASQGAIFSVPIAVAPTPTVLAWLEATGVVVVSGRIGADRAYWDVDMSGPTALVVGAEDSGLSAEWADITTVEIPLHGSADSLNASVAAALLLYEAVRQRRSRRSDGALPVRRH